MGVVHHHHRVVLVGEIADANEVGLVALHGEDAVGSDHAEPGVLRLLQLVLQVCHVLVTVDLASGLAETDAVDDARVVQGVADDGVLRPEHCLEQPRVGVEARGVQDRRLGAEPARDLILELFVDVLRTADEPYRGHPEPMRLQPLDDGLLDLLAVGQTQVVVGAHDELVPRGRIDLRSLRGPDDLLLLVQAALPNGIEFVLQEGLDCGVCHTALLRRLRDA